MKKKFLSKQWRNHQKNRRKYQSKRATRRWKERKKAGRAIKVEIDIADKKQRLKAFTQHSAPKNFSFVKNTNEVLKYFADARDISANKGNITFDIAEIDELTSDTIALLVSSINSSAFHKRGLIRGNYPLKPELNKLFTQSGFHKFVEVSGQKARTDGNFLHKESHYKVEPLIARNAALVGIKHTFGNERPYEPLYGILIECMSNTNNHANLNNIEKTYWWLYVYNDLKTGKTSYSFIDLGVGIFESIELQDYFENIKKKLLSTVGWYKHINIVDDLLAGKIQSRIDEDNAIRGKGIPQIVEHSKRDTFNEFYIISNDIKINLKSGEKEELFYNFDGTFLYWEIQKTK